MNEQTILTERILHLVKVSKMFSPHGHQHVNCLKDVAKLAAKLASMFQNTETRWQSATSSNITDLKDLIKFLEEKNRLLQMDAKTFYGSDITTISKKMNCERQQKCKEQIKQVKQWIKIIKDGWGIE